MNADLLLEKQPLDDNGRKKDYIRIMSELWDAKGYGDLGLSSQNLRNQAARLEKTVEESPENLSRHRRMQIQEFSLKETCLYGCTNRSKLDRLYFFVLKKQGVNHNMLIY